MVARVAFGPAGGLCPSLGVRHGDNGRKVVGQVQRMDYGHSSFGPRIWSSDGPCGLLSSREFLPQLGAEVLVTGQAVSLPEFLYLYFWLLWSVFLAGWLAWPGPVLTGMACTWGGGRGLVADMGGRVGMGDNVLGLQDPNWGCRKVLSIGRHLTCSSDWCGLYLISTYLSNVEVGIWQILTPSSCLELMPWLHWLIDCKLLKWKKHFPKSAFHHSILSQ